MKTFKFCAAVASLAGIAAGPALAADPIRSNEIRLGMYFLNFELKSDPLSGAFIPPGYDLGFSINKVNTPYVAYKRRLAPHWAIQLAGGVPPKTEIVGQGPATVGSVPFVGPVLATAKWFSPTLLLNHVFFDESAALRPYLGVGVNYTHFFDRKVTDAGAAVLGGPTSISLSNSTGPAISAGLAWHIQDHWLLNLSYDYARVNSNAVLNTAGALKRTTIRFNPYTWVVSVGYAF